MADRFYSEEQAQEILRLAARRETSEPGMSRDRLIQAAAEMGIEPEAILAAEREVMQKQGRRDLRRQYVTERKREFLGSISSCGGTCILLFGINYLTSGFHGNLLSMWAIWPCGFIALHALKEGWEYLTAATALGDGEFEQWYEKQKKKERVSEWIEGHPDASTAVKIARMACAEFDPDHKDHAIDRVHKETGLRRRDAKDLVNAIYREHAWGTPVDVQDAKWSTLEKAQPLPSAYEAARSALDELGPSRRLEAVELVRARTGLGRQEAEEAVQAVSELSH